MSEMLMEFRKRPHWSHSSLDLLLSKCSLKWAFQYVRREQPEKVSAAKMLGSAFHAAADHLARLRKAGEKVWLADLVEVFTKRWRLELESAEAEVAFKVGEDAGTLEETGHVLIATLVAEWPLTEKVLDVAVPFQVPVIDSHGYVAEKPLVGEADVVVETSDGQIVIIDWKTAARKWAESRADNDQQATCMLYGLRGRYGDHALFRYDVVTKTKTPSFQSLPTARRQSDFDRLCRRIEIADRIVAAGAFHPDASGQSCGDCPYGKACSTWHEEKWPLEMAA